MKTGKIQKCHKTLKGGEKNMRKAFSVILVAFLAMVLVYGVSTRTADAKVSGQCVNCHTMHNSQGGAAMRFDSNATPLNTLLRGDCVSCHSSTVANEVVKAGGIPVVYSTTAFPAVPLAGGNFYGLNNDASRHNVVGIAAADAVLTAPPGFDSTTVTVPTGFVQSGTGWGITNWAGKEVTCAGAQGCHGDRSVENTSNEAGVKGGHHGDDSTIDGTTTVKSYRFLAGIKGVEMNTAGNQWEQAPTATSHNGYYGAAGSKNSINYLCGECHTKFHATASGANAATNVGTASPWLRHPTDVSVALLSGADYTAYNPAVPVASALPKTGALNPTTEPGLVMCLSCHRAHGSNQLDLLRFDYTAGTTQAGLGTTQVNATGCLVCHVAQR